MGISHVADAIYERHGIPPTAKLILVVLADHINAESGWAWPSVARLSKLCGVSRRQVFTWLEWLEQAGHLEVKRRPGWANHYRIPTREVDRTSAAGFTGGVKSASLTSAAGFTQTKKTRREPASASKTTPTPPPLDQVLAAQEQYR